MSKASRFAQTYFHGTRADLMIGELITVGHPSNLNTGKPFAWVYVTGTLDVAIWGAELARGYAPGRTYVVEPTGTIIDDPNVMDRKFPGNPTCFFRSREPFRVIAEVTGWHGHSESQLREMKEG